MANIPPRTSRQPKLRSSCDRCGAAKLKCDRGQPACGRCLNLGQTCVYGVSRKMGKPPRDRLRAPTVGGMSRTPGYVDPPQSVRCDAKIASSVRDISVGGGDFVPSYESFSNIDRGPSSWNTLEDYQNNIFIHDECLDTWRRSLPGVSVPDFPSAAFCDNTLSPSTHITPLSLHTSPELESHPTLAVLQSQIDDITHTDNISLASESNRNHNCSREARDIMHNLASLDPGGIYSARHSSSVSSWTAANTSHCAPFDHILRVNQEARERLERLLLCPCKRDPHLALLYASVISLILSLYQQAADCAQQASWNLCAGIEESMIPHVSSLDSMSQSPQSWSSTVVSATNTNSPGTPTLVMTVPSTPTHMAIGSFNIEDQQMQTVLRDQLLLGEIRKAGQLIILFASQSSGQVEEDALGSVNSLHVSLNTWLRKEHVKIADTIRVRLKELSS